jgi:hypothetical protein
VRTTKPDLEWREVSRRDCQGKVQGPSSTVAKVKKQRGAAARGVEDTAEA